MKKLLSLFLTLTLLLALAVPAMAADAPCLVDNADLLDATEEEILIEMLEEVSVSWNVDVVVVTEADLQGASSTAYADDFFDYGGYGEDGILWLIDMDNRQSTISTAGSCIAAFTDAGQEYMQDELAPMLTDGEYYEAIAYFTELCDDYLQRADEGTPYDTDDLPYMTFDPLFSAIVALVIGLVVALIVTGIMKAQLKSVRSKAEAADYLKSGSLQVTESRDLFLYRHVNRMAKPKQNSGSSVHTSSSGRSHGGSSRGF